MKVLVKQYIFVMIIFFCLLPLNLFAAPSILNIHVSILPQKYFVEKIGKDRVKVSVLVKPGKSPTTYSPSPTQMKNLSSSDVYFRIGVPFENGILNKIKSISQVMVVDTRKGIELRNMEGHDHHGGSDHDDYRGKDPHIWMDPLMVKIQVTTIFKTLVAIDPGSKDEYKKNYDLFVKNLDKLDQHIKTLLTDLKGENLFVFHPSFGYFTDAYGLNQIAVETMGKSPKGKTLSRIIKLAKQQKTRVIFVQPQFDKNTAQKIASAIDGTVTFIDPLAYDYMTNMKKIAKSIAQVLKE